MFPQPFPSTGQTDFQIFRPLRDATATRGFHVYRRPLNATKLYLSLQGAGGGGGGGFTGAPGTTRGGGGGGGAGGSVTIEIPWFLLGDVIYIKPGMGGNGGAASTVGLAGNVTFVGTKPDTADQRGGIIQVPGGGPGGAGTGAAAGAAGTAGGGSSCWAMGANGLFQSSNGQAGAAGGAQTGAVGGSINPPASQLRATGGTGGAGVGTANTNFAGGAINAAVPWRAIAGGLAGGGAGNDGFSQAIDILLGRSMPLFFSGGTGGGSSGASGTGGKGGRGGPGSGGGGGGGGVTGGAGGNGGDGYVIAGSW